MELRPFMHLLDAMGVPDEETTCLALAAATLASAAAGGPQGEAKQAMHQFAHLFGAPELELSTAEEIPPGSAAICIELERMLSPHVKFGPSIDSAMKSLATERGMFRSSLLETGRPPGDFPSFANHMRDAGVALFEAAGEGSQPAADATAVQHWLQPDLHVQSMKAAKLAAHRRIEASLGAWSEHMFVANAGSVCLRGADALPAPASPAEQRQQRHPATLRRYPDASNHAGDPTAEAESCCPPVGSTECSAPSPAARGDVGSATIDSTPEGQVALWPEGSHDAVMGVGIQHSVPATAGSRQVGGRKLQKCATLFRSKATVPTLPSGADGKHADMFLPSISLVSA